MSDNLAKRRVKTSSITVIVSLSLVLFMLGMLGLVVLNARKLSKHIKENIGFQVILKDTTTDHPVSIQQIPEVVRHFSDLGKLGVQLRDEVFRNSKSRRGRWNVRVVYRSLEGIFVDYDCFVSHNHTGKKNERNYEKNAKILKKNQPES